MESWFNVVFMDHLGFVAGGKSRPAPARQFPAKREADCGRQCYWLHLHDRLVLRGDGIGFATVTPIQFVWANGPLDLSSARYFWAGPQFHCGQPADACLLRTTALGRVCEQHY